MDLQVLQLHCSFGIYSCASLFDYCYLFLFKLFFKLFFLQILWENCYNGDIQNDCLVSVGRTDFQIPFSGQKFHSHKYKFWLALWYKVAVWINGPYEPGIWNDLAIFRNSLLMELAEREQEVADNRYYRESPKYVKCPRSIRNIAESETLAAFVCCCQETINRRFKQWGILKQVYRGDISKHGVAFLVCAIIMQLAIENGEL